MNQMLNELLQSVGSYGSKYVGDKMGQSVGGSPGSFRSGLGGAVGSGISNSMGGALSGFLNPAPQQRSPFERGQDQAQFNAGAFPGTNPWEQLSGNTGRYNADPGGQSSKFKQENKIVDKTLRNQREIADNTVTKQTQAQRDIANNALYHQRQTSGAAQTTAETGRRNLSNQTTLAEAAWRNATAKRKDSFTNAQRLKLERARHKLDEIVKLGTLGSHLGNPGSAASSGANIAALKLGLTDPRLKVAFKEYLRGLYTAGWAGNLSAEAAKVLGQVFKVFGGKIGGLPGAKVGNTRPPSPANQNAVMGRHG